MAEVRDSRFQCLFKELDLPIGKIMEELSDFFCSRYLTSLRLYEDVAVLEELHTYHVGIITNGAHDNHTDSQFSKVRHRKSGALMPKIADGQPDYAITYSVDQSQ